MYLFTNIAQRKGLLFRHVFLNNFSTYNNYIFHYKQKSATILRRLLLVIGNALLEVG